MGETPIQNFEKSAGATCSDEEFGLDSNNDAGVIGEMVKRLCLGLMALAADNPHRLMHSIHTRSLGFRVIRSYD
jgi:hypothetical protein